VYSRHASAWATPDDVALEETAVTCAPIRCILSMLRRGVCAPSFSSIPHGSTVVPDRSNCGMVQLSNLLRPGSMQAFDDEALPGGLI
jgi:hypothetical protein